MADLRSYALALAVGLLVGVIYALLNVRSPAPPIVALVGLAGILLGEQAVPLARKWITDGALTLTHVRQQCASHVFGRLPTHADGAEDPLRTGAARTPERKT